MHALVTGAGGFLGLYITERLVARGDRVRAFCRGSYRELDSLGVQAVRGDLTDRDAVMRACEGVDCVFHVAARPGISVQWRPYYETNTLGTHHVVEACVQTGVKRLVYTSSPSVTYGSEPEYGVNEERPYPRRWLAHYARSKALAEQEVLAADGGGGLATCALRPHLVWGPRDRHLVPRLLRRARQGRLLRVGDGSNLVDMIYVENAADAHILAAEALQSNGAPRGRAYFLSQGEPVNCWQWINQILAMAGLPPVSRSVSLRYAWAAGAVMEGAYRALGLQGEPPMTRFLAMQLATTHYFDISAARRDFGYTPRVSTDEGMRRLGRWIRATLP